MAKIKAVELVEAKDFLGESVRVKLRTAENHFYYKITGYSEIPKTSGGTDSFYTGIDEEGFNLAVPLSEIDYIWGFDE